MSSANIQYAVYMNRLHYSAVLSMQLCSPR